MRILALRKSEQNRAMLDPWTVVHFATGLATGLMKLPFRTSIAAAAAYELVEQYVERQPWGRDLFETEHHESLPNALVDVVVFALGHGVGRAWNDVD